MLILYYYIYYICIIAISVNFTVINNIFENPGDTKILHVVFRKWPKRQAYFHHGRRRWCGYPDIHESEKKYHLKFKYFFRHIHASQGKAYEDYNR